MILTPYSLCSRGLLRMTSRPDARLHIEFVHNPVLRTVTSENPSEIRGCLKTLEAALTPEALKELEMATGGAMPTLKQKELLSGQSHVA